VSELLKLSWQHGDCSPEIANPEIDNRGCVHRDGLPRVNAYVMSLRGIAIATGAMMDATAVMMIENVHKHIAAWQHAHPARHTCLHPIPGLSAAKAMELLQQTFRLIKTVSEVASVSGEAGSAETATDPAPIEMFETTIQFKPQSERRPDMTPDKLVQELDSIVQVPGLSNIWCIRFATGIDMPATAIESPVGVNVGGRTCVRSTASHRKSSAS
jgi:Cu/Ag efflux pump CusA